MTRWDIRKWNDGWGGVRCDIDVRFGRGEDSGMRGFEVE